MSRWKASGIHLLISFLVIGLIAAYIIHFWYPLALMSMAKADRLLLLIGGIDLVVGPLLTLIVYKTNKPSLKFDLSVIALFQLAFLCYGLNTIYQSRPVFLIAVRDQIEMVFANEIDKKNLAKALLPEAKSLGFTKPKLMAAFQPSDPQLRDKIMWDAIAGGNDIQALPQYYASFDKIKVELLSNARKINQSNETTKENAAYLLQAANAHHKKPEEIRYVIIRSRRGLAAMLLDAKTGDVIGPVKQSL